MAGNVLLTKWRRIGSEFWKPSTAWPRFDPNDAYDGLSKSLEKLYYENEQKVLKALGKSVVNEQFKMEV